MGRGQPDVVKRRIQNGKEITERGSACSPLSRLRHAAVVTNTRLILGNPEHKPGSARWEARALALRKSL